MPVFVLSEIPRIHALQKPPKRLNWFLGDEIDDAFLGMHGHLLAGFQVELLPYILRDHYLKFGRNSCCAHMSSKKRIDDNIVKQ